MAKRLDGKVAVISGAAAGIGQASAIRLAEEGAQILLADREDATKTLDLVTRVGGKAEAVRCDVSDPAIALLEQMASRFEANGFIVAANECHCCQSTVN